MISYGLHPLFLNLDMSSEQSPVYLSTHDTDEVKQFINDAHTLIDFIAEYYTQLRECEIQVSPNVAEGFLINSLPDSPPDKPMSFDKTLEMFKNKILPGVTHWMHPNFFGYFPSQTSFPSIFGDILTAALNTQGFSWMTSPAATELEIVMIDWLAKATKLPSCFHRSCGGSGCIQGSASESIHIALLAAREMAFEKFNLFVDGANVGDASKLVAYASDQAHSSFFKSAKCAGLRTHTIDTKYEENHSMNPKKLFEAMESDIKKGYIPCFVGCTVGTTSTGAFDNLKDTSVATQQFCAKHVNYSIWLHCDAAYTGSFKALDECQSYFEGLEDFDSYCFNPHKAMRIGFDCSAFFVSDKKYVQQALTFTPIYLKASVSKTSQVLDFKDWQVALGRRFRSLKLFFFFNMIGVEGMEKHLQYIIATTKALNDLLIEDHRFNIYGEQHCGLVCFYLKDKTEIHNVNLHAKLNNVGYVLTNTKIGDQYILRVCIGSASTNTYHIKALYEKMCEIVNEFEENRHMYLEY